MGPFRWIISDDTERACRDLVAFRGKLSLIFVRKSGEPNGIDAADLPCKARRKIIGQVALLFGIVSCGCYVRMIQCQCQGTICTEYTVFVLVIQHYVGQVYSPMCIVKEEVIYAHNQDGIRQGAMSRNCSQTWPSIELQEDEETEEKGGWGVLRSKVFNAKPSYLGWSQYRQL